MDAATLASHITDPAAARPFPRSLAAAPAREMIRSGDWAVSRLEPLASLTHRECLIAGADMPYGCWERTVRDRRPRSPEHDSITLPARIALPDDVKGVR